MNKREDKTLRNKYIKLWICLVVIFSCAMILIQVYINSTHYIPKNRIFDYDILRQMTPDYPPPLFNFME
jgi:hypothetical protein